MAKYRAPKKRLHREFLYLNHDTIVNSLSALEAGAIDEIIQKANTAREGGFGAEVGAGPARASGGRKKINQIEEEMVRTRTVFSAFDAWYRYLDEAEALGRFDQWTKDIRDELSVGDTIEFDAIVQLTPVHRIIRTFLSFAEQAEDKWSPFKQKGEELEQTRNTARLFDFMLGGADAPQHFPVYMSPYGSSDPRVVGRLDEQYIISPKETIDGEYTVIAQVDQMLSDDEELSAIRTRAQVVVAR